MCSRVIERIDLRTDNMYLIQIFKILQLRDLTQICTF